MSSKERESDRSFDVIIVGGGAAGFFAAATCAELAPSLRIVILERSPRVLSKVKVSGGGRCNVTHACFDPSVLVDFYPRGNRELLGPFYSWAPADTVDWFERRGVSLKEEADGRMFPVSDDSQTIVDCLEGSIREGGVEVRTGSAVEQIHRCEEGFRVFLGKGESTMSGTRILLATGGLREGKFTEGLRQLGHQIEVLAPALFTFHIDDSRLKGLEGLSVENVSASVEGASLRTSGPILVTHWGVSGPVVLKLSSVGARWMQQAAYQFDLSVNWTGSEDKGSVIGHLESLRSSNSKKRVWGWPQFGVPRRLWERLVVAAAIPKDLIWSQISSRKIQLLADELTHCRFSVKGKSMNKEEFVTCGGVRLSEVHFKTMESKKVPGLYFAGETLDVDALTGGFNFQAAWTTGYLAGRAMASMNAQD
ncbi:NAD(P)/FAD-dependent oxidoreductase [Verrucomicrobia bacterium]|nr:NAD(P)/FAD-dependent oxidoreductase [Verrucomicrobiota bacterium]